MPGGTSGEVMRRKITGGRKAGFARSQCPEKHPGTQGCLRQEARPTSLGSEARKNIRGSDAPKEHRRTQGWLRQVAMPGGASGDARLPSAGGDFEACLFAQTSFCLARPIRSIDKELIETFAALTRRRETEPFGLSSRYATDRELVLKRSKNRDPGRDRFRITQKRKRPSFRRARPNSTHFVIP